MTIRVTRQELACLLLRSKGYTAKQIAKKLGLSPRTVETHFWNAKKRNRFLSNFQLVVEATRLPLEVMEK